MTTAREHTVRVAVIGAAGRMGAEVCRAVAGAPDLELVAAVDPSASGQRVADVAGLTGDDAAGAGALVVADTLDVLVDAEVEVAVEFTGPATVGDNLRWLLEHGIHAVVGATGVSDPDLARAAALAADGPANALIAPNFAIGAVLLMQFAAQAARHLPEVEIIELHHDRKLDAPSGTALRTAELIEAGREQIAAVPAGDTAAQDTDGRVPAARGGDHHGVRVHSVRLPGLIAHQEVLFGGSGETLTIRHDSLDRTSFMPGVLHACRHVGDLDGLAVGLEHVL